MSFTLKVVFQGKIINLGNKITSLPQIQQEIQMRLPHRLSGTLSYQYDHQNVQNFEQLVNTANTHHLTSIKLFAQLQGLISGESEHNSFSMLSAIKKKEENQEEASSFMNSEQSIESQKRNSLIISLKEHSEESDILIQETQIQGSSFLVIDQAFQSIGPKSGSQQSSFFSQKISSIKSSKNEESESVSKFDQLFEKKMNELLKENVLVPIDEYSQFMKFKKSKEEKTAKKKIKFPECLNPFKKQEKQLDASKIQRLQKKITVTSSLDNKKSVISGIEFLWEFSIAYPSQLKKYGLYIMDEITGYMTYLKGNRICVGPYIATKQEHFSRSFRLCFFSEETIKFIGPKFGFKVQVIHYKQQGTGKSSISRFEQEIQRKMKEKNMKVELTEVLDKLKYIGIDQSNFKEEEEIIEELLDNLD